MVNSGKKSKKKAKTRSPKEEKLFQNLLKVAHQFMKGKGYFGLTEYDLRERLQIPPQHHDLFHLVLEDLLEDGIIEMKMGSYRLKKSAAEVVTGVLRVHPRGFGFLQAHEPSLYPEDVFVPKHLTMNAVDGDTVEVLVNTESISEKGPEGKVVTILQRGRTHLAGIICNIEPFGDIVAYVPLLGTAQRVVVQPSGEFSLAVGDRVVMEVTSWGAKETETNCKVSQVIGHISDPSCDITAAIEEYELRSQFPVKAIEEAEKMSPQVSPKEIKAREDLRHIECFTIDPDTAKDFDDAISLSKDEKGHYHLGVHIADVSHYVQPGSALDTEAKERCNSTYFPNYCLPMLPRELSENLCSLKPNVNRLTASVFVSFDAHGNELNYRMARTVIKSCKRYTYKEAFAILNGQKKSKHLPALNLMVELCGLLKKKRYERGSVEFAMPELVILVDEKGVPVKTDYISYDITHQLVEEFMLKANEIVARHLSEIGKNLTYRIHDVPAEENLKDFSQLATVFGYNLSEKPSPAEIQKLFDEALSTPYGEYLATSYIRRMRLAIYSPENIGHYGLGLSHYCHFTSPIRRYVDLVVHRILFGQDDNRQALEMIASRCSEQERISSKAENHVVLLKKLRLLDSVNRKEPGKQFEAVVTKVKNFGISFEVLDYMLESFLHVSELADDYYVYDDVQSLLKGRRTGQAFQCGDRVTVMIKNVNFITLESSWTFVGKNEDEESSNRPKKIEKRRSSSKRQMKHRKEKKFTKGKPRKKK